MEGVKRDLNLRTDAEPLQLLKELARSPLIYIRLLGIICSIVVFSCVADHVQGELTYTDVEGETQTTRICYYYAKNTSIDKQDDNEAACDLAIAAGVIGFLLCLAFLVKDLLYVVIDFSDNIRIKKVMVLDDAATNGLWAVMWFVAFVVIADRLRESIGAIEALIDNKAYSTDIHVLIYAGIVVAFSFFCILIWIAIVVVNGIIFFRIWKGLDSSSRGRTGYALIPEVPREEGYQGDEGGIGGGQQQYTPPEY